MWYELGYSQRQLERPRPSQGNFTTDGDHGRQRAEVRTLVQYVPDLSSRLRNSTEHYIGVVTVVASWMGAGASRRSNIRMLGAWQEQYIVSTGRAAHRIDDIDGFGSMR